MRYRFHLSAPPIDRRVNSASSFTHLRIRKMKYTIKPLHHAFAHTDPVLYNRTSVSIGSSHCNNNHSILPEMTLNVEQAVDVVEIQQTLNLFAIAVNQHQLGLLPEVFTTDVTTNFDIPGGDIQTGLDAVTRLLMTLEAIPSLHYQSTNFLKFTGSQQAHATTYLLESFFGTGALQGQVYQSYGR